MSYQIESHYRTSYSSEQVSYDYCCCKVVCYRVSKVDYSSCTDFVVCAVCDLYIQNRSDLYVTAAVVIQQYNTKHQVTP